MEYNDKLHRVITALDCIRGGIMGRVQLFGAVMGLG